MQEGAGTLSSTPRLGGTVRRWCTVRGSIADSAGALQKSARREVGVVMVAAEALWKGLQRTLAGHHGKMMAAVTVPSVGKGEAAAKEAYHLGT